MAPRRNQKPTLISLFSGCGGAALGFWQAGFEVRVFVENNRDCCATLHRNWIDPRGMCKQRRKPEILSTDITRLSTRKILEAAALAIGEADSLEGGFPCQGFSIANSKRHVDDSRNVLYRQCVRIIRQALPRTFMLENVPGLVSMAKGAIVRKIISDLAHCGYSVNWNVLDAADYGVPQHRRRVIILGKRVDVMRCDFETGEMGLHMGVAGSITHPEWFEKKYPERRRAA